jgi:hypothetical protein
MEIFPTGRREVGSLEFIDSRLSEAQFSFRRKMMLGNEITRFAQLPQRI